MERKDVENQRSFRISPVTPTPEEEEEAGHIITDLTEAKTRSHPQKHACLLHASNRLFIKAIDVSQEHTNANHKHLVFKDRL